MPEEPEDGSRVHGQITGGSFQNVVIGRDIKELHFHSPRPEERPAGGWSVKYRTAVTAAALGLTLLSMRLLTVREEGFQSVAQRGLTATGALLVLAGVLWGGAVATGIPQRLRRRRAHHLTPLPEHLDRMAHDLAVALARKYEVDERQSRVQDPVPIPVRWTSADPLVSDHNDNIQRTPATVTRDSQQEQPFDLDGHFDEIGGFFARLRTRRLVVLGAPGAGKSALALRLAHTLLKKRAAGEAVPVLLSLASWHPAEEDPWQWAARRLVTVHPTVLRSQQAAHDLITSGRILPILDGLDELPEAGHGQALRRLRRSLGERASIVLTCRSGEYEAAVDEAQTVLPAATVVQLEPLGVADLVAYLPRTAVRTSRAEAAATKWAPVLARLADLNDDASEVETLRSVLSTPLMVSLARVVYSETRADPKDLLARERFGTRSVAERRAAVERHLFDAFLSAAYEDSAHSGRNGEQVRRWAGYLAAHLRRTGRQDIEWWRLDEAVPWSVRWLGTGLAVGAAALAVGLTSYDHPWWRVWFPLPPWAAVLLLGSIASIIDWTVDPAVGRPQRLHWPTRQELRALRMQSRWMLRGLLVCLLTLATLFVLPAPDMWGLGGGLGSLCLFLAVVLLARLLGLLSSPADPADAPGPTALLRADRRTELVLGVIAPVRNSNRRALTEPLLAAASLTVLLWQFTVDWEAMTRVTWLRTGALLLLAWVLCRWSTSAGGRLVLARCYLSFSGALPWRVMAFLRDAHDRDVLRQSGGVYRFRHVELRNRLAETAGCTEDDNSPDAGLRRTVHRWQAVAAANVGNGLLAAILGLVLALVASDMVGPYREPASSCALVSVRQVKDVIVQPVKPKDHGFLCQYDEKSPFRPDRRVMVYASARGAAWAAGSGTHQARQNMRKRAYANWQPVSGLGDEARMWTGTMNPHGAPGAQLMVRAGNLTVTVSYIEEYASPARVIEAARLFAREALRRAGIPVERIGPGVRDISGVPPVAVPAKRRTRSYRLPEQSVHGAAWHGEEYSDILTLSGLSIPLRTSPTVLCPVARPGLDRSERVFRCESLDGRVPRIQLDIADRACGEDGCSASETTAFQRRLPGWSSRRWSAAPQGDARYAVHRPSGERYEMSLFTTHAPQGKRPHLLWIRATVDSEHAALAQKVINSAYTQATPPRPDGPQ
ncbi:NACHT domain-containing protein [Streptomyces massasporeus]|uniref:NACHT domain-containing protein n=1 Tax=Streptomyces massasporeus TaxID=67324 RepID=UPI00367BDEA8